MKKQKEKIEGTIIDVFPDLKFKVKTKDGSEIFAYLSGKMRLHKIKILGGDIKFFHDFPDSVQRILLVIN